MRNGKLLGKSENDLRENREKNRLRFIYKNITMRSKIEASKFRIFLKNLIDNIINQIPNEHGALIELKAARTSLFYQAPEILDNTFLTILNILQNYLPLKEDDTKNLQWLKNIRTIWIAACDEIKKGPEIGASTDEVMAPPAKEVINIY